jgi:hypothetical protein
MHDVRCRRFHIDGYAVWTVWTASSLVLRDGSSGAGGRDLLQHPVSAEELLGCEQIVRGTANSQVVARRWPTATRRDWEVIELHSPALRTAISFRTHERALESIAGHHLAANRTWDVRGWFALWLSRRVAFTPALRAELRRAHRTSLVEL